MAGNEKYVTFFMTVTEGPMLKGRIW